jgi:beta-aspartyl-dipeptidase (metallo-type)
MLSLLLNADLYDPRPRGRSHLLIAGETVVWIGTEKLSLPRGLVREWDLEGRRVIPGLIDGHVHLTGGGGEAGPHTRVPPVPLIRTPAELVTVARGLNVEGFSAYCLTGGYHVPPATVTGDVRRDLVLIDLVLGVGELAISDHRSSQPTLDELLRVAGDVHVGGLMSGKAGILHLHVGDGARGLGPIRDALDRSEIPAMVFNPTHVNRRRGLFDEAVSLAQRGCTIDLTAFPVEEGDDAWSAAEALVRYLDAGFPADRVTVSSDGGGCFPSFDDDGRVLDMEVGEPAAVGDTLRELLAAGQPLERVLPAFTSNPARLLLLPRKGKLAVDADADLVVLDEVGAVTDVMARGRWQVTEGRVVVRGTFE